MFKVDDVVVLLGAGCSVGAGIPASEAMLAKLHDLLDAGGEWEGYRDLYCRVRALILYADAMQGKFNESFNIERLVASLGELEKREQNLLHPFTNELASCLQGYVGPSCDRVAEFRRKILQQLNEWVTLNDYRKASYYAHFFQLAADLNFALRIFTLNYDLCLEKNVPPGTVLERGFDNDTREWAWGRFDRREEGEPAVYYYKMHGSIDWARSASQGNVLQEVENSPKEPDLIFGTTNKLHYVDPYLFYAYEFRKYTLASKVIVIVGYSFGDEYINGILRQALENNPSRKIVVISPAADEIVITSRLGRIGDRQVVAVREKAEECLPNLNSHYLTEVAELQDRAGGDPFQSDE